MENMNNGKKILFLSALDFKEKSIQVIRKTPEYYASVGWEVDYIVARDNVSGGNYSYEREINPCGVNVNRFYWPFVKIRAVHYRYLALFLSKISSFIVIILLAFKGYKKIKSNSYDVVYGYELQGVLAVALLKPFLVKEKIVTRFQGTFVNEMLERKEWFRLIFNADLLMALRIKSDLTIMTDDGTQGDRALQKVRGAKQLGEIKFWTNGVDSIEHNSWPESANEKIKIISISRLVGWKRVDRCIKIIEQMVERGFVNFEYEIIGGGEQREKLEQMVDNLSLRDFVKFSGALTHQEALNKLKKSQIFFSMYDSSNVGNPLLEAIRANKLILTLNNGDTGTWIEHGVNGFIYEPDDSFFEQAAKDIESVISNNLTRKDMLKNLHLIELKRLSEWNERLGIEEKIVSSL